ncbi:MAG: DinB family protein [Candidatus Thorarchaeota archaeon]
MMSCIESLLDHTFACREPLLNAVGQLTKEEFVRDLGVGRGSIRDIIVHLVNTEIYWTDNVLREKSRSWFRSEEFSTVEEIGRVWSNVGSSTRELFENQNEETLQHVKSVRWDDRTVSFTVAKVFMHIATHETHHRGLIVGLLRQLGYDPPDTDMI